VPRVRRLFVVLLATSVTGIACANVLGIEDRFYNGGPGDASTDEAAQPSSPPDAGVDAESVQGPCPEKMVHVAGTFCIDAFEVTQREYGKFLEAMAGDASTQIAECAGNTTFAPGTCQNFRFDVGTDYPMACIDWCDANAYCAWKGKRLCGLTDGGAVPHDQNLYNTTSDQWFAACSRQADGFHKYPYGSSYDASAAYPSAQLGSARTPAR